MIRDKEIRERWGEWRSLREMVGTPDDSGMPVSELTKRLAEEELEAFVELVALIARGNDDA